MNKIVLTAVLAGATLFGANAKDFNRCKPHEFKRPGHKGEIVVHRHKKFEPKRIVRIVKHEPKKIERWTPKPQIKGKRDHGKRGRR
ncbi:MAG: hypothetical protein E7040_07485 [Lentisphaerae bacterium]|nr:hypothetical protein [Lentisphaerota bacterium]